jgi:hypothetical protein
MKCGCCGSGYIVLGGQGDQDCLINLVLTERRLVLFEAKAAQPTPEAHDAASFEVSNLRPALGIAA